MNESKTPPPSLAPASLARALDLWALRREKVLHLIDVRAAREARRLAKACRLLACTGNTQRDEAWQMEWLAIRQKALAILAEGSPSSRPPARSSPPASAPPSEEDVARAERATSVTKPSMPRVAGRSSSRRSKFGT